MHDKYINVAVALPVHKTFVYQAPEYFYPFISVGKRVLVPFGRRRVTGYILSLCETSEHNEIKLIFDIFDEKPLFPASMTPFFKWVADYYIHPIGSVIKNALPNGLNFYELVTIAITKKGKTLIGKNLLTPLEDEILNQLQSDSHSLKNLCKRLNKDIPNSLIYRMEIKELITRSRKLKAGTTRHKMERHVSLIKHAPPIDNLSKSRKQVIDILKKSKGAISVKHLKEILPSAPRLINSLKDTGYVSVFNKKVYRDPFGESIKPDVAPELTQEQNHVVSTVIASFGKGFKTYLLAGVTGSGKTEVYMRLAMEAIKRKIAVLLLVPEIALISQIERRFRARFGECVAMLHSGLSAGEWHDQWMRIINKEVLIVVGARSAIFAPFENIGIIIVDEEHDASYKQDNGLHYNARDLAIVRAKFHNAIVLLGSATPSVQSCYNVSIKKFTKLTLTKRIEKRPLPTTTLVDLRKNKNNRGIQRFITPELCDAMRKTLDDGKQVILFLNRRGFASFPVCAACGKAIKCKNCDISLTLHKKANAYKCHYCGFTIASASKCPECGSRNIKLLGFGTEKIESAVNTLFPKARVAVMDRDTTKRKGSILKILKGIKNKTIDVLIGTQMVAKGHDFPDITLVGIICADLSLSFPDFRAEERTFQLLSQVSGRAGRGDAVGNVVLQTYNPEHFSVTSAQNQDFEMFYDKAINFRKALNYPPFSRIIQLKISGKNKEKTKQYAQIIGNTCKNLKNNDKSFLKFVEILGPIEAPIAKIANQHRWQILLKSVNTGSLHQFANKLLFENRFSGKNVRFAIDVDPFFMV